MKAASTVSLTLTLALLIIAVGCAPAPRFREGATAPKGDRQPNRFHTGQSWTGYASYYGPKFHGRKTANGEVFDQNGMTAAHKQLPFGTLLKVTNLSNGRSCTVRINDRGPFVRGRMLDLSLGAAQSIGMMGQGVAQVRVEIIKLGEQ